MIFGRLKALHMGPPMAVNLVTGGKARRAIYQKMNLQEKDVFFTNCKTNHFRNVRQSMMMIFRASEIARQFILMLRK